MENCSAVSRERAHLIRGDVILVLVICHSLKWREGEMLGITAADELEFGYRAPPCYEIVVSARKSSLKSEVPEDLEITP